MVAYYVLMAVPIILFFLPISKDNKIEYKKKQQLIIIAFFTLWFVLLTLRNTKVGVDLSLYIPWFKEMPKTSFTQIFEKYDKERAYYLLTKLISLISTNEQFFLGVMALLSLAPIAIFYYKESQDALLSISLFVIMLFPMYFSGMRQILAMALMVPAYYCTKKKKIISFILLVLLASTFHESALIGLLLYPIFHLKITKQHWWILASIVLILIIFNNSIFLSIVKLLGGKYEKYAKLEGGGAFRMLFIYIVLLMCAFVVPQDNLVDKEFIGLRNILFLVICIQTFGLSNDIATRLNFYFMIFVPILIPKIVIFARKSEVDMVELVAYAMTLFFIFYFFYRAHTDSIDVFSVYPYLFFWQS